MSYDLRRNPAGFCVPVLISETAAARVFLVPYVGTVPSVDDVRGFIEEYGLGPMVSEGPLEPGAEDPRPADQLRMFMVSRDLGDSNRVTPDGWREVHCGPRDGTFVSLSVEETTN